MAKKPTPKKPAPKPKKKAPGKKRRVIDWEAIEREYRLGQKSLRVIATEFKVTPAGVCKRAKKEGWIQDKSDEVRQRTQAALLTGGVNKTVNREVNAPTPEDVDRAVETNVAVVVAHRKDIQAGRAVVTVQIDQLNLAAKDREELEEIIEQETSWDKDKGRRNRMLKAISLPVHAGTVRDLSTTLKNLIPLERQAFGIDERPGGDDAIKTLLDEIAKRSTINRLVQDDDPEDGE